MTSSAVLDWFAERDHPRLAALVVLGAATALLGGALELAGAGPGRLGYQLAVVGLLVLLFGGSGAVAFAVFERGFD